MHIVNLPKRHFNCTVETAHFCTKLNKYNGGEQSCQTITAENNIINLETRGGAYKLFETVITLVPCNHCQEELLILI